MVFVWTADTGATTLQQKNTAIAEAVTVGDRVLVSVDPTTLSKGYSSSGYGTLTFYEYVAPTVETEEDLDWYTETDEPSDSQVVDGGGKVTSADGKIITTKTINGTSEENIFDITLTVQTQSDIQIFLSEPDMAVVVVMDVSNTMNSTFTDDTVSRYDAAVEAANQFIDQFTEATDGLSQLGVVAFNTDAHEIVELQPCSTTAQSTAIKNEMASETDTIVSESGYYESDERFTNIEGGLKRAYDMLAESGNSHQYIILLTDGFPTTYLKDNSDGSTNYEGYYTTLGSSAGSPGEDGVFYDYLTGYYCSGTSYSDKAAIRAREMATKIKSSGAKVFSIGVDVAGQTIAGHERNGLSIIERTSSTYEIGGANDLNAYKNWLGNSVGSGYYYDSVNQTDITNAFANIFDEIVELNKTETKTIWTATDPMPVYDEEPSVVGFIHFYDKDGNVVAAPDDPESITGAHEEKAENTAYHEGNTIHWDLKKSGYTTFTDENDDSITYYLYTLKYRVRLVNEKDTAEPFSEDKIYETNGEAYLEYRNVTEVNGVQNISDLRNVSFSKPSVQGYLAGFDFIKQNDLGVVLPGAEFTLSHDDENCTECHGDSTALTDNEAHEDNYTAEHAVHSIGPYVASSDENGTVSFSNIPSGHVYTLTETVIPDGYMLSGSTYSVDVAYDVLTVTETLPDGTKKVWTGDGNVISNIMEVFLLPETGGTGTLPFTIIGVALMALPILYSIIRRKRERRFKLTGAEHDMV
ncbi:MAG: VWA domain-containing protein [Clostridia bacterium]|nr:VWA domain-containing protein [Clostridia bacterium]